MPIDLHTLREWGKRVDVRGWDECWPWTGARSIGGYGTMRLRRKDPVLWGHRVAIEAFHYDVITDGYVASHLCGNAWCVNPRHLTVETQSTNLRRRQQFQFEGVWFCKRCKRPTRDIKGQRPCLPCHAAEVRRGRQSRQRPMNVSSAAS